MLDATWYFFKKSSNGGYDRSLKKYESEHEIITT